MYGAYIGLQVVAQIVGKFKVPLDFIVPTERARITLCLSSTLLCCLTLSILSPSTPLRTHISQYPANYMSRRGNCQFRIHNISLVSRLTFSLAT